MPLTLSDEQVGKLIAGLALAEESLGVMVGAAAAAAAGFGQVTEALNEARAAAGLPEIKNIDLNRAQRRAQKKAAGRQP